MFTKRIIPCLDVNDGRVVKGVNFVNLRDAGDPVEIAAAYDKAGADEVVFLDITATSDARETVVDMVRKVAEKVFIPFTVGGGIRTVEDFKVLLREGADKISINSSAIFFISLFILVLNLVLNFTCPQIDFNNILNTIDICNKLYCALALAFAYLDSGK